MIPPAAWTILYLLLPAAYAVWLLRWMRKWQAVPSAAAGATAPAGATVVVPVRDEAAFIGPCLDSLLAQEFPGGRYEIVVVDDFSSDGTPDVVASRMKPGGRIRLIRLAERKGAAGSKKAALHAGIGAAAYPVVVTTDGDCTMGPRWLLTMVQALAEPQTALASGPVTISGKSLFARLQALEYAGLSGLGAAAIDTNHPLLCSGANLAFRKEVYLRLRDGGTVPAEPASGDDVFLMLAVRRRRAGRMRFVKSADAVVTTRPEKDIRSFFRQRVRWGSKVAGYREGYIVWTGVMVQATHLAIIAGACVPAGFFPFLAAAGIKMTADYLFLRKVAGFYGLRVTPLFPVLFFLQLVYVPLTALAGLWKTRWKGRRV